MISIKDDEKGGTAMYTYITCLGFSTTILCAIWSNVAPLIGLGAMSWAGFSGCTSYFACPDKGVKGVISCICCLMSGVAYAMITLYLGKVLTFAGAGVFVALITVHLMCIQSKIPIFSYIPGTFFGSFSTFAAGGNPLIIPLLLFGIFLGLGCDKFGGWIFKMIGKKEEETAS